MVLLTSLTRQAPVLRARLAQRVGHEVNVALRLHPERHAHARDLLQARVTPLVAVGPQRRADEANDDLLSGVVLTDEQRPARGRFT